MKQEDLRLIVGELISLIAHDSRSSLFAICVLAQDIKELAKNSLEGEGLRQSVYNAATSIVEQGQSLQTTMNQIFHLASVDERNGECAVHDIVDEARMMLATMLDRN